MIIINYIIRFSISSFLIFISLLINAGCSNSPSNEEQQKAFESFKSDFRSYSLVLSDFTMKFDLIVKKLDDDSIDYYQALGNLNDLHKKFLGFNLLIHDKWTLPEGLTKQQKKTLNQSIFAFEDCLVGYKLATEEIITQIENQEFSQTPDLRTSIISAKNNYQKAKNLQEQVSNELNNIKAN